MLYNQDEEVCKLGKLIQEERKRQGMSQEELAELLGVARVTVTHMELHGKGLNDVFTRRNVAKALGMSPLALGVLSADTKPEMLYDTRILQKSFDLHVQNYFTASTVTLSDVDEMVQSVFTISKSLDHKNKDVLKVLHGYSWLGIDLATQKLDGLEIRKYIGLSVHLGEEINNPVLLARTYIAASEAVYALGDYKRADKYAQKAANLKNVPSHVHGLAILDVGKIENNPNLSDQALTIVQNNPREEDIAYVRLSPDLCQISKVIVLLNRGDISEAESILADAEENTPAHMLRRQSLLHWLRARAAMKRGAFDEAAVTTLSAIPLAKQINSQWNIERLRTVYAGLLESGHAKSQTVRLIGQAL